MVDRPWPWRRDRGPRGPACVGGASRAQALQHQLGRVTIPLDDAASEDDGIHRSYLALHCRYRTHRSSAAGRPDYWGGGPALHLARLGTGVCRPRMAAQSAHTQRRC